jgi:Flp pilus assembly protein CpaB
MRKLNATLLLGIAVAVLGFGLVLTYGRTVQKRIADGRETTKVLVASDNLVTGTPAASLVTGKSVALADVPAAYVADGVLTSLDSVQGRVLLGPVPKGTQLSEGLFGTPSTAASVQPAAGNVALAVEVGLSPGVARYLSVGSVVDVFVTYTGSGSGGSAGASGAGDDSQSSERTKLFLSGTTVLAISGADRSQAAGKEGEQASSSSSTGGVIVVLDLSPQDAERVVNAVSVGQLYLGLSAEGARHTTPTGATPDDVVSSNR